MDAFTFFYTSKLSGLYLTMDNFHNCWQLELCENHSHLSYSKIKKVPAADPFKFDEI